MTYRLFYAPDNASLIVRLTLEELQQPYETRLVDRAMNGQKHPDYLKYKHGPALTILKSFQSFFQYTLKHHPVHFSNWIVF